ncbi:MAG TPA: SRPBCC family protein [Candidatus Dormibacteraeota bacterium]|nr:SRPBCC family protein [Candidatus Dormibacteraeota bacterium]
MIVNVCPAAVTSASPDRVWQVLVDTGNLGDWTDTTFVSLSPPGPAVTGQVVNLTARGLGRTWPVTIEVGEMDPGRRWIDFLARLPLGLENHEHLTLTQTPEGGTLIRFN